MQTASKENTTKDLLVNPKINLYTMPLACVITCINLNKTKTLSSVPSNSSSEVPLLPARSFSSKNFAISSAGRFCYAENKTELLEIFEQK